MTCRRILATLIVAALVAAPAFAQPPGGGRGQRGGMQGGMGAMQASQMLTDKAIQEELKLGEDQVDNLRALFAKQREDFGGMRDMDPEERRERMQELTRKYTDEVNKILSSDQQKRLKQLQLQAAQRMGGWGALAMNPEVSRALDFTEEQRDAMQSMQREMRESMRDAFQGGGGDREEMRARMEEMRKGMDSKIEKLLTDAQKSKLKELMGEPFKGEFPRPGRRGPGGGGR